MPSNPGGFPKRTAFSLPSPFHILLTIGLLLLLPSAANAVTCTSNVAPTGNWNTAGNWTCSSGGNHVPLAGEDVIIAAGDTINLNTNTANALASLTVNGTLGFGDNTARTARVSGVVTVAVGGTITINNFNDTHSFFIGGSLTNDGVFDMAPAASDIANVTFNGAANQTVSGSGGTTRFNNIAINNSGAATNNIVEISSSSFSAAAGFLTLTQGIFKVSGSFTITNTFFPAAAYTINADEGIWINNSNVTVSAQNADATLNGLLRISLGNYNIGTAADNDLIYGTGSTMDIQGGALNVAGAIQGTTVTGTGTTNTTTYSQSGGTVTICIVDVANGAKSYGSFDIQAAGSSFTMSGGTIIMLNPTNVAVDYAVGATLGSVTGGTLQLGTATTTITNPYAINSSTPVFNMTVKGTVSPRTYLVTSPLIVKGDLLIETGARVDPLNLNITIAGNWTNNGTYTRSAETVTFNSGSNQNVGGTGSNAFNAVTMNGAGVTLTAAASLRANLTLTNGNITTGANILTLENTGTTSGGSNASYVIGTLKKTAVPNGSFIFPVGVAAISGYAAGYTPLDLANATGGGDLTVTTNHAVQPVLAAGTSLNEYWTLTEGGTVTADLTFHYLQTDVNGTEANYQLIVVSGGNATRFLGTVNTVANTIARAGVQTFSDWTAGEPNAPTAVKLTGFEALEKNGQVMIQWRSGYEAQNLGYHVYREQNGKRTQLTPSLVAGSALIAGRQTELTAGLSYRWYDHLAGQRSEVGGPRLEGGAVQSSSFSLRYGEKDDVKAEGAMGPVTYWLEDVDLDGTRTLHGPVAIAACGLGSGDCKELVRVTKQRSQLLRERGEPSAAGAAGKGVLFRAGPATLADREPAQPETAQVADAGPIEVQRGIAAKPGVKLGINQTGWYRVTQPELVAAGLAANADAQRLQLFVGGVEVPLRLSGSGLAFTATDYLEFYGQRLESPTAALQTYYLVEGDVAGKRVITGDRAGKPAAPSGAVSYAYTVERKERMIYFSGLLNGDGENFFGQIVSATTTVATVPVSRLDKTSAEPGQLQLALQGVTSQSHLVQVRFNGADLGTISFANTEHPQQTFTVPAAVLAEGNNTVELTSLGGAADVSLVDTVRLTYAHQYAAENNILGISVSNAGTKRISGFTDKQIRVVDITDAENVRETRVLVSEEKPGEYAADVQIPAASFRNPRTLLVFAESALGHALTVTSNEPSTWSSQTAGADYVIITSKDMVTSVKPLAALRRSQGLVVEVVDVEDLYDEYTFGEHSPNAIHDFLERATTIWTRKPRYVLLAGDASYDPKNYFGLGSNDLVPTKLVDTTLLETASDDWLADFNSDGLSDLAIGRLPVRTAAQLNQLVGKIVGYETTPADTARGALLVADTNFESASRAIQSLLPARITVETINRGSADDATIHNQIVGSINQGPRIANYVGHGSNGVWTSAPLLSSVDAAGLTNTNRLSVFTMMTCFNGYFQDAQNDSLAEALLKSPGGAVAVWASTTMTEPAGQSVINQEFYRLLFAGRAATLGEAARAAKGTTTDADVRRTWTLFGDPALRLR